MRHSCRCSLHPALTLLMLGTVGSVVAFGIHVWLEPWTSTVAVTIGSFAGMLVSHALGADVVFGFGIGAGVMVFLLGLRALRSIFTTLDDPALAGRRAWFSR